jgi:hypothetical protein
MDDNWKTFQEKDEAIMGMKVNSFKFSWTVYHVKEIPAQ